MLLFKHDGTPWTSDVGIGSDEARLAMGVVRVYVPHQWDQFVHHRLPDMGDRRQWAIRQYIRGRDNPGRPGDFDAGWTVEYLYDQKENPPDIDYWITGSLWFDVTSVGVDFGNPDWASGKQVAVVLREPVPAYNLSLKSAMPLARNLRDARLSAVFADTDINTQHKMVRCRHQGTGEMLYADVL